MINELTNPKINSINNSFNKLLALSYDLPKQIFFLKVKRHMPMFDKIFDKIFPKDQEVNVHEVLKRSPQFIKSFEEWKISAQAEDMKENISASYNDKLSSRPPVIDIEIYHSSYANGFIIYPQKRGIQLPLEFLMEYIKDVLETEGYRLVHSDRKMKETGKIVTELDKYYLKPPISHEIPIDQLFGNVIIELSYRNHEPSKFKLVANIYSDRLYGAPRNFEDLILLLFEKRSAK